MEPKFTEPVNINGEDYYKALREYKKSDHPIVFGWYSEWTGTGTNMNNQLRGIPDSMDIVSLWGGAFNLTEAQKSDLKEVREKKGLRVLYCQHITDIGRSHTPASVENDFIVDGVQYNSKDEAMAAYWGWYGNYGDTSEEGQEKAIRKYARVIIDSINKYNYDGFDIDFEPNFGYSGNLSGNSDRMHIFLDELSKEFGPKSGTGRILMVDGEPQTLNKESGPLLDYYVVQAYYCRSDEGYSDALDGRFDRL
ncbi:glycoside hydrolase family 18 [Bacteroides thetaiotaomicron]|nr:glycoside hydrolase family 18 [Bacteroides thetaiotaomicron]